MSPLRPANSEGGTALQAVLKGLKTKLDEVKTAAAGASLSDPLAPMDAADSGLFSIDT